MKMLARWLRRWADRLDAHVCPIIIQYGPDVRPLCVRCGERLEKQIEGYSHPVTIKWGRDDG